MCAEQRPEEHAALTTNIEHHRDLLNWPPVPSRHIQSEQINTMPYGRVLLLDSKSTPLSHCPTDPQGYNMLLSPPHPSRNATPPHPHTRAPFHIHQSRPTDRNPSPVSHLNFFPSPRRARDEGLARSHGACG
jgi:hypothetical protein